MKVQKGDNNVAKDHNPKSNPKHQKQTSINQNEISNDVSNLPPKDIVLTQIGKFQRQRQERQQKRQIIQKQILKILQSFNFYLQGRYYNNFIKRNLSLVQQQKKNHENITKHLDKINLPEQFIQFLIQAQLQDSLAQNQQTTTNSQSQQQSQINRALSKLKTYLQCFHDLQSLKTISFYQKYGLTDTKPQQAQETTVKMANQMKNKMFKIPSRFPHLHYKDSSRDKDNYNDRELSDKDVVLAGGITMGQLEESIYQIDDLNIDWGDGGTLQISENTVKYKEQGHTTSTSMDISQQNIHQSSQTLDDQLIQKSQILNNIIEDSQTKTPQTLGNTSDKAQQQKLQQIEKLIYGVESTPSIQQANLQQFHPEISLDQLYTQLL